MKTSEIKELSTAEIQERIATESEALVRMEMNHAVSPVDNPQSIRASRRTVARLKTILRLRQISETK
ncbi:50S ribosomal protein L29 [Halosquirtibacter laminarini]|uniref:50S ribosomal protein L29 n=1 Tax=Halosquirtibacter laminarini TaxID=3374600 RepID=A0AC61NCP3_9BACT|nr:50S ribosomal protein L29 [Prolixibacteraceae bacterium]